jgi:uncharacterized RDD family membrane protein YckC
MNPENEGSEGESMFPEAEIVYSRFWDRLGALLLDGCIMAAITLPVTYFNITSWKIPSLYIIMSLISILYKPVMECCFAATLGKMIVGLQVVGHDFQKITISEEIKRLSFYLFPGIIQNIITTPIYFSTTFESTDNYRVFNGQVAAHNPSLLWITGIVFVLFFADTVTFFINQPNRALHDVYANTNVIERRR